MTNKTIKYTFILTLKEPVEKMPSNTVWFTFYSSIKKYYWLSERNIFPNITNELKWTSYI